MGKCIFIGSLLTAFTISLILFISESGKMCDFLCIEYFIIVIFIAIFLLSLLIFFIEFLIIDNIKFIVNKKFNYLLLIILGIFISPIPYLLFIEGDKRENIIYVCLGIGIIYGICNIIAYQFLDNKTQKENL